MKILLVSLNYAPEPTGIAPYSTGLAEGLASQGHEVRVIAGIPHYPEWRNKAGITALRTREVVNGVRLTRVRHHVPRGGIGVGRLLLELSFALQVLTSRWARPDVIITVTPSLFGSAAVLVRRCLGRSQVPMIVWLQDLYSQGMVELGGHSATSWVARSLESCVLRRAAAVVVIHRRFRGFVSRRLGVHEERIAELRNWAHTEAPRTSSDSPLRKRYSWGRRPVVLHTGSMGTKQGLSGVVDAARLAERENSDTIFVLVGDGSERPSLEAASLGCPNIQLLPPLPKEEYGQALAEADVLLLHEQVGVKEMALPSKLTAYFTAAKPVVAAVAADGVSADEVRTARAGRIVPPGDPRQLLAAIDEIIAAPADAVAMGRSGRDYAAANLTAASVLRRWDSLLAEVVGGRVIDNRVAASNLESIGNVPGGVSQPPLPHR